MATETLKLRQVIRSPTTIQYRKHALRNKPFYTPAFALTKEKWQRTLAQPWLKETNPLMPPYPYGANEHFPEANYGLYGGTTIRSGNKISKGRNKGKTKRKWFPNIRLAKLESKALEKDLYIPVRARTMRTIKKCGGLDEYLMGHKPARIKELGLLGWKLRWLVMRSPAMQAQFAKQRTDLGLDVRDPLSETFEQVWNDPRRREVLLAQQDRAWEKMKLNMENWEEHMKRQHEKPKDRQQKVLSPALINSKPSDYRFPELEESDQGVGLWEIENNKSLERARGLPEPEKQTSGEVPDQARLLTPTEEAVPPQDTEVEESEQRSQESDEGRLLAPAEDALPSRQLEEEQNSLARKVDGLKLQESEQHRPSR
ncbi:54S ribosomal protein L24, mitochondrial [Cyphellophora attinorum]|uniref:54S ribosomal protein L24, mitochondrial n=1 Tax=Cyphellophora attinorum TaxID=1664694 RepID=A0A0N1HE79_9EURO|nr:54S ribosomal protein L24, mitochondrial [Phialophora attinorum]KPI43195.1 54S ribosomal protein L24, mitochondrial [Phialophora attinorum]